MKLFLFSRTLKLPSWALVAGFFFFSAATSKADVTEAQMRAAFVSALKEYAEYSSGDDAVFITSPWDESYEWALSSYLSMRGRSEGIGSRFELYMNLFWPYIRTIGAISNELRRALFDSATGDPFFGQFTFTSDRRLRVFDEEVDGSIDKAASQISDAINDSASNLRSELHGAIDDAASSVSGSLGDLSDDLSAHLSSIESYINDWYSDWRAVRDAAKESDDQTDFTVVDAEDRVEIDEERVGEEVTEAYEKEDLPDTPYRYEPEVDVQDLSGQDLGLSSLSGASDHNALITLVSRSDAQRGPIPQIEVDFGANDELVDGAGRISSFLAWMYRTLGGLFLSLKGIHMWRVCYTSSVQAATGNDPTVSLAWNPF